MKQKQKKHVFHLRRIGFLTVLLAAFFIVRLDAGSLPGNISFSPKVLAYATEMSRSGLLSGTNTARSANGLGSLTLDAQLNNSAQMKAEHMAAHNYWAHTAPDGTEPWYFFQQAGYSYTRAGENLAYGFSSSQSTIDGWMNSPSHQANVLGQYIDVGFGIVNTPSYQSEGQQTIVVAHYGSRASAAPAPVAPAAPAPAPPAPSSTPAATQPSPSTPAPEATPPTSPAEPTNEPAAKEAGDATSPNTAPTEAAPIATAAIQTGSNSRISVLSMLTHKSAPVTAIISLVLVCVSVVGYALTHRSAFQQTITTGEHFVATHPGVDASIIAAITALILLTTYGTVK